MAIKFKETQDNLKCSKGTVEFQLRETYCRLLISFIDQFKNMKILQWEINDVDGGSDSITTRVSGKILQGEQIITKWTPTLLQMCLGELLWHDSSDIQVKELQEYLSACCDLSRLLSNMVLEEAACQGLASEECYDIVTIYSKDKGHYINPKSNQTIFGFNQSDYLIKLGVALGQKREEGREHEAVNDGEVPLPVAIMGGGQ